jgi:hypothetical protein
MSPVRITTTIVLAVLFVAGLSYAGDVKMSISGPGAIDENTIKVGEPFSIDLYFSNDTIRRGISVGFEISSEDISKVIHVSDSEGGLNANGDIKGHNGWQDKSIFDFTGVMVSVDTVDDWDGALPDTVGFAAIVIKKRWHPHELMKGLSMDLIVPEPGTLVVDSTFFPPGGDWMYDNEELPQWGGPYRFKVVE